MTSVVTHMQIGAYGWKHSDWCGDFYPDDLPDEWMFSYYSNEFRCVLIPHEDFTAADEEDVGGWADDAGNEFLFYVEHDLTKNSAVHEAKLQILSAQLGGLLIRGDIARLRELENAWLDKLHEHYALGLWVDGKAASLKDRLTLCDRLQTNACWSTESEQPVWQYRGALVGLLQSSDNIYAPNLKNVVQTCLRYGKGKPQVSLIFSSASPKIELLRSAKIISELL